MKHHETDPKNHSETPIENHYASLTIIQPWLTIVLTNINHSDSPLKRIISLSIVPFSSFRTSVQPNCPWLEQISEQPRS